MVQHVLASMPHLGCHNSTMFGTSLRAPTRPMVKLTMPSTITAGIIGPGKRWEHYPVNKNGNVVRQPMHVRLGDTVQVGCNSMLVQLAASQRVLAEATVGQSHGCCAHSWPQQVVTGSDKGKIGKVTTVISKTGHVVVDGVNIKFKHVKPRAQGETGQILQRESPIHHSNVMLYSESQKVRSRVGYRTKPDGTKVRVLVKTGEELPLSNKQDRTTSTEGPEEQQ